MPRQNLSCGWFSIKSLLLLPTALLLLLAGCQNATDETIESDSTTAPDATSLVIYSGRSESLVQPIIDQFAAATGIDVEVRYGSTSEMAAAILEEGANSPADLFYAQDPGGLGAVENAGLLAPLPAEIVDLVPADFRSAEDQWVGISGRARVVVYNSAVDPTELPAGLEGFTDPRWQDRIGWAPTNGSFQAMVTAMRALWGEARTTAWLEGIQANNPTVYSGNTPIVAGVAAGEVDVGFVNHYYLYRFLAEEGEEFPARNQFLTDGGPGSLLMVSGAGILRTASNRAGAERFLSFLLSVPGQQYFTAQTFEYPVVEGVALNPQLPPLETLTAYAVAISPGQLADLQGTQDLLLQLGIIE